MEVEARDHEKHELMKNSQISLWIEEYDDIFSDFDSRPYSERALSGDFLHEAKNASRDKPWGGIELRLMVPEKKRDKKKESLIRIRLLDHFRKHHKRLHHETRNVMIQGAAFTVIGMASMLLASALMLDGRTTGDILRNFLFVLLEPGGWFFFWEGLRLLIFERKRDARDVSFYEKMTNCDIVFMSY
jgi:hypothetical protein